MTNPRQKLGREGETRAAGFLETRGYRIVARNVRVERVEIDLIARRGATLVFVEVKSRRAPRDGGGRDPGSDRAELQHGIAAEAVDDRKQRRLRRGAHAWLAANPLEARRTRLRRFDVVTCLFRGEDRRRPGAVGPIGEDSEGRNETTAPEPARWSIEHWESAF